MIAARQRAKKSGLACTITEGDLLIPPVCPVLGVPMQRTAYRQGSNSPSLDRLDNSLGYIPGNVRVISWRANRIKGDATVEEVEKVLAYMKGRI